MLVCAVEAWKHKKRVPGGFWVGCVTLPISWKSDPRFKVSRLAAFSISIFIRRSLHCFHWPETTRVQMRVQPFSNFSFLECLRPVLRQADGVPEFFSTEIFFPLRKLKRWNNDFFFWWCGGCWVGTLGAGAVRTECAASHLCRAHVPARCCVHWHPRGSSFRLGVFFFPHAVMVADSRGVKDGRAPWRHFLSVDVAGGGANSLIRKRNSRMSFNTNSFFWVLSPDLMSFVNGAWQNVH